MENPYTHPLVHATECRGYCAEEVRRALEEAFDAHGFLPPSAPPARVLIKPNLLRPAKPESAVTTHPAFIVEAARILLQRGHTVTVSDGPAIGSAEGVLGRLKCLLPLRRLGVHVAPMGPPVGVALAGGRVLPVSRMALDAEVILSLPKWKTHVQVGLTAAIKNTYGCLPGPRKALQHIAYGHREREFIRMLVELSALLKPALTVVDGIVAMEGNGPGGGLPKPTGLVLSGRDPVALDRVLASLMGFGELGLFQVARELGVGETEMDRIPRSGEILPSALDPPFLLPRPSPLSFHPLHRALALARGSKRGFELD